MPVSFFTRRAMSARVRSWEASSAVAMAPDSTAAVKPPWDSISVNTAQALSASLSVRSSTKKEPPAGSTTKPRWDSSRSNRLVLRAMRDAKVREVPGIPPGTT